MISEAKVSYCRDLSAAARMMQMVVRDDSYNGDYKFSFCDPATGMAITGIPSPSRDVAYYNACVALADHLTLTHEPQNDKQPGVVPDSTQAGDGGKPASTDEYGTPSA